MTRKSRVPTPDSKPTTGPSLSLAIQYACDEPGQPSRAQLRRWVKAALEPHLESALITLRFVDEEEGRTLNREFRGRGSRTKDYATNVLSFPYSRAPQLAGDLVLCQSVILKEAAEQGKPLNHHLAHLVLHGMLHLQGHDHETDAEAEKMEARERLLLKRFRIPDPY